MLTHWGLLVYLMPPHVGHHQLVYQLHAHASSGQICQECVLHLRPLKHLNNTPVDL